VLEDPRHCSRRPAPPPSIPRHVLDPADALAVLGAASALVVPGRVAALVLDLEWRPLDLCLCDDDADVEDRSRLLLDLYAGDTAGVVFASARRARRGAPEPTAAEVARFERLARHGDECGSPVVDWFVLAGELALSVAELNDAPWRWLAPCPDW
jgi:hypothetical protein